MPLSILTQTYIVCSAIGSIFLLICAAMGATHHGGAGHGNAAGHSGAGHGLGGHGGAGNIGAHGAGGHASIGHSAGGHAAGGHTAGGHGAAGHGTAGHGSSGHTSGGAHGAAAHGSTGDGGQAASGQSEILQAAQTQARTGPFHAPNRNERVSPIESILGFFNPTVITTFLAFFGLTGLFLITCFPFLGLVTLAPALGAGFIAVKVMTTVMNYAFSRMYSSSAATLEDVLGHMAEVTVPITHGRTGEVTYIVASKRYTSPARATTPDLEIKKGTKVIIAEKGEKFMLVDLWTDSFMDPAFEEQTLTTQEKRARQQSDMNQL